MKFKSVEEIQEINSLVEGEGWAIFECGLDYYEIQKDDEMDIFVSDQDAVTHVRHRASEGSAPHQRALEILDL